MKTHLRAAAAALTSSALILTGCGSAPAGHDAHAGHDMGSHQSHGTDSMPMNHGDGLSSTVDGYTLKLQSEPMPGMAMPVKFTVLSGGKPVTRFATEQTRKLHFYVIGEDLSGFQHLHPVMGADGTWTVTPAKLKPGKYRFFAQATPAGAPDPVVLSVPVSVAGNAKPAPLPRPTTKATVDGYTVALTGRPANDKPLDMSFTKSGEPVDLQPYLGTSAHVTAFHKGDLAFAHLHPMGREFMVDVPKTGTYRLFVQFKADGKLHTAALTTTVT